MLNLNFRFKLNFLIEDHNCCKHQELLNFNTSAKSNNQAAIQILNSVIKNLSDSKCYEE